MSQLLGLLIVRAGRIESVTITPCEGAWRCGELQSSMRKPHAQASERSRVHGGAAEGGAFSRPGIEPS